jgi:hypothetical protein
MGWEDVLVDEVSPAEGAAPAVLSWEDVLVDGDEKSVEATEQPAEEGGYVDPDMPSGDAGDLPTGLEIEGELGPAKKKEWGHGPLETFMGVMENITSMASAPVGMFAAAVDMLDQGVGETVGNLSVGNDGLEYTAPAWTRGEGKTGVEVGQRAMQTIANNMYVPDSESARDVADLIPDEAMRIAEALPPSIAPGIHASREGASLARRGMDSNAPPLRPIQETAEGVRDLVNNTPGAVTQVGRDMVNKTEDAYTNWRATKDTEKAVASRAEAEELLINRWLGPEMTEVVANASPAMKKLFVEMAEDAQTQAYGGIDPITGERIRSIESGRVSSRDTIGRQFEERTGQVADLGKTYLADLAEARRAMQEADAGGYKANTTGLIDSVTEMLLKEKITVDRRTGEIDFSSSEIPVKEREVLAKAVERLYTDLQEGSVSEANFGQLDTLKGFLQKTGYGNSKESGQSGFGTDLIQRMSGQVNDFLRAETEPRGIKYGEANDNLKGVIGVINKMNKAMGGEDVDFNTENFTPQKAREVSRRSRGLTNNTASGINLDETLRDMDEVLTGAGDKLTPEVRDLLNMTKGEDGKWTINTDMRQLAVFAEMLNQVVPDGKHTSFHDLIKSATSGQGGNLANAAYNAIYGNAVGATAEIGKSITSRFQRNNPESVGKRHDKLKTQQRKFEEYNREEILKALSEVLEG